MLGALGIDAGCDGVVGGEGIFGVSTADCGMCGLLMVIR